MASAVLQRKLHHLEAQIDSFNQTQPDNPLYPLLTYRIKHQIDFLKTLIVREIESHSELYMHDDDHVQVMANTLSLLEEMFNRCIEKGAKPEQEHEEKALISLVASEERGEGYCSCDFSCLDELDQENKETEQEEEEDNDKEVKEDEGEISTCLCDISCLKTETETLQEQHDHDEDAESGIVSNGDVEEVEGDLKIRGLGIRKEMVREEVEDMLTRAKIEGIVREQMAETMRREKKRGRGRFMRMGVVVVVAVVGLAIANLGLENESIYLVPT